MYEILACNRNLDIKSFLTQILVVTASVCVCVIGNRYLCVVAVCVFVHLGYYKKSPIDWTECISHCSGGWKIRVSHGQVEASS